MNEKSIIKSSYWYENESLHDLFTRQMGPLPDYTASMGKIVLSPDIYFVNSPLLMDGETDPMIAIGSQSGILAIIRNIVVTGVAPGVRNVSQKARAIIVDSGSFPWPNWGNNVAFFRPNDDRVERTVKKIMDSNDQTLHYLMFPNFYKDFYQMSNKAQKWLQYVLYQSVALREQSRLTRRAHKAKILPFLGASHFPMKQLTSMKITVGGNAMELRNANAGELGYASGNNSETTSPSNDSNTRQVAFVQLNEGRPLYFTVNGDSTQKPDTIYVGS